MKSWTERQIFCIIDSEFCKNEADDPKDAIMYYYPPDTTEAVRCTLCCHLMGICHFMKMAFSPVTLIRLTKGKFAVKMVGKYILALKGSPDMPDSVLQRQLQSVISSFRVYYDSFETVWKECQGIHEIFLERMSNIWSVLLPLSQHHGDSLALTFNIIPTLDLPKTAGLLFLQAAQFLQACQRFDGVLSGCLFCNEKVLCSQLPPSTLEKLALIREKQKVPGVAVPVTFDLPGNVKLLYAYLTEKEVAGPKDAESTTRPPAAPREVQRGAEAAGNSSAVEGTEPIEPSVDASMPLSESGAVGGRIADQSLPSSGIISERSSTHNAPVVAGDDTVLSKQEMPAGYREQEVPSSASSGELYVARCGSSTSHESLASSSDPPVTRASSSSLVAGDEATRFKRYVLYSQSYNDTLLVLLLDARTAEDSTVIHSLWNLGMNTLMTLETDVRNCLEMAPNKCQDSKRSANYLHLQFDGKWSRARGDLKVVKDGGSEAQNGEEVFNESVQRLHEDFLRRPGLYEATVCSRGSVVYGHRIASRETYFQVRHAAVSAAPASSLTGQASSAPQSGFRLQPDLMCTIATRARKVLEREHRIVLI